MLGVLKPARRWLSKTPNFKDESSSHPRFVRMAQLSANVIGSAKRILICSRLTHFAAIDTLIVCIHSLWTGRRLVKIRPVTHVVQHFILAEIER
jgi:hypothetical protein